MPLMQLGLDSFEREEGNQPSIYVENMTAELSPESQTQVILQSAPPLHDRLADMGAGPVRQLYQLDGVINGALLGVSGKFLYQGTSQVGTISGSGPVSIAGNEIGAMIAAGGLLKYYDAETLATVAMPDDLRVVKVFTAGSRFVAIPEGTGKFYWTEPLEATFDSLAFATAEASPDRLLDGLYQDSSVTLFGTRTTEFWQSTTDEDLPFTPTIGLTYPVGIKNTGACCQYANSFAWVGDDNVVYMPGQSPARISNAGLEEKIAASAAAYLFAYRQEGTEYLALRVDTGTWVRSAFTGRWARRTSYDVANWPAQCWSNGVFGSAIDGRTFRFGSDDEELDSGKFVRRFFAGFPINGGGVNVASVGLRFNAGTTPFLTGANAEPMIEMRHSRDGGNTWSRWRAKPLGRQGKYRTRLRWRGLGLASQPGLLCEFRCTAPVPLRVSAALVNEPVGGR